MSILLAITQVRLTVTGRTWPLISSRIFDTSRRMSETVMWVFMINSV